MILHNLLCDNKDTIPQEWYDELSKEIEWDVNDSDQSTDSEVGDKCSDNERDIENDRRIQSFNDIVNNYM